MHEYHHEQTCLWEGNLVLVADFFTLTPLRLRFITARARLRVEKHLDPE